MDTPSESEHVDWQKVHDFFLVVLHASVTDAARARGVSRTAIYKSLRELERQLDTPLFQLPTGSQIPTEEGQLVFTAAKALQDAIAAVQAARRRPNAAALSTQVEILAAQLLVVSKRLKRKKL
ncbi:LysR family transcriptional regulator [Paraburkholderia sp. J12]|uniref:LysR family transcriptional regulator n=1 Tax=Paraburkholderia sp. J12 TaxID=2805432 RepID=UPI002ABDA8C5|nr:LysR family transcriptional regulator [Paraburkholderia sp. J12]